MVDSDITQEIVVVDPGSVDELKALAAAEGVSVEELGLRSDPVTAVSLLLVGSIAAIGAITYLLDKMKGGQVIDMRAGARERMFRTKDLAYGLVLILAPDGSIKVEVREPRNLLQEVLRTIESILRPGMAGAAEELAGMVRNALGDRARVTTDTRTG